MALAAGLFMEMMGTALLLTNGPVLCPAEHHLEADVLDVPLRRVEGGADQHQLLHQVADGCMHGAAHNVVDSPRGEASLNYLRDDCLVA